MKTYIMIFDGVGGCGKTTLIRKLKSSFTSNKLVVKSQKFPMFTDEERFSSGIIEATKRKLKEDTEAVPMETGIVMLREICNMIRGVVTVEQQLGTEEFLLLVDRAWLSTMVCQLGVQTSSFVTRYVEENLVRHLVNQLGVDNLRINYWLLNPDVETVYFRKVARIAADDPTKLTTKFLAELRAKTNKDHNDYNLALEYISNDCNIWHGVLSGDNVDEILFNKINQYFHRKI